MELLKDGGRAAIVLPDGTLFGEGIKTRIKQKLLRDCNLHTIVLLKQYQAAVTQADEARLALKTALQACLEQSAESGK